MKTLLKISILMIAACGIDTAQAQTKSVVSDTPQVGSIPTRSSPNRIRTFLNITVSGGPNLPVIGGGTLGRLTKWTGFTTSNSFIGDTTIFEDKSGNVGIGTDSPTSKLSVAGQIQTLSGGFKFPDGSVQMTSASGSLFSVAHDSTLKGNGTSASPLGVRIPLTLAVDFSGPALFVQGETPREPILKVENTDGDPLSEAVGANCDFCVALRGKTNGGVAVLGVSGSSGDAGLFDGLVEVRGDLSVSGTLSKGGGSFKIDHPLDPENKYLYHSFVESPDMKNIYDGTIITDGNGDALVTLPEWFGSLNKDFRYQLTVIGTFAQAIIAEEIQANRFAIKTSLPGVKVSWQVTGIRQDAWANKNRIPIEQNKPDLERGFYLHPDAFGLSKERGIDWAHDFEGMTKRRQQRLEAQEDLNRKSRQH